MFDVGFWELALLAIIALIVLGPERLPEAARTVGRLIGRARSYASGLSRELDNHAELRDLRDQILQAREEMNDIGERFRTDARKALDDVESTAHTAHDEVVAARDEAMESVDFGGDEGAEKNSADGFGNVDAYVDDYLREIPEQPPGYYAEESESVDDADDVAQGIAVEETAEEVVEQAADEDSVENPAGTDAVQEATADAGDAASQHDRDDKR